VTESPEVTVDDLAFRWRGGLPVLDFTATVGERWGRSFERLRSPADLVGWLVEAGLGSPDVTPPSDWQLAAARELREALYRIATAVRIGQLPDTADVECVNRWARKPTAGPELRLIGTALDVEAGSLDVESCLTRLAREGVELLGGHRAARVRECARPDCSLLFLDESRGGVRRWCSMDDCGSRAKMAALRARRAEPATKRSSRP
jgi:predicted RNA-binding Zn ribbon-like protein